MDRSKSKYFHTAAKMNDALLELLKVKPFEYITVSEICQRAGVNRSTFYLHYENTADLFAEMYSRMIQEFLSCFPAEEQKRISNRFADNSLVELNYISSEYLDPYLSYIKENRNMFSTVLKHGDTFACEKMLDWIFQNVVNPIMDRYGYPRGDRKYIMRFYFSGIHAAIGEWIEDGCRKSNEDMIRIIHECIFGLEKEL